MGHASPPCQLLKLGIEISERTVSRLLPRKRRPPSQSWKTFLDNHVGELVSVDFFTVPTATFRLLFVLVLPAHHRRRLVHFNVTEHPTLPGLLSRFGKRFPKIVHPGT
jgi:putative transposase